MFALLALSIPLSLACPTQLPVELPLREKYQSGFERTTDFALSPKMKLPQEDWLATACFFTSPAEGSYVVYLRSNTFYPLLAFTDPNGQILNWAMPLPGQEEVSLAIALEAGEKIAIFIAAHPELDDQAEDVDDWRFELVVRASDQPGHLERNSMAGEIHRVRSEERALRQVEGETSTLALFAAQRLANLLTQSGEWTEALEIFERTLALRREHYGATHRSTLQLMLAYGRSLHANGQLPQAREVLDEVVTLRREHQGADSYPYSNAVYALGKLQLQQGEREAGYQSMLESIAVQMAIPRRVPEAALKYAELGQAYGEWGSHDLAESAVQKAMDLVLNREGMDGYRAVVCLKAGVYYLRAGKLAQAEPILKLAYEYSNQGKAFHMEHLARMLFQFGVLYLRKGEFDEAEQWIREARQVYLRSGGELSPGAAQMLWELGFLRVDQGRLHDAQEFFQQALQSIAAIYGEQHPEMWQRLGTVGALCEQNGLTEQAADYYLRALTGRNQFLQSSFPVLAEYQRFELLAQSRDCESLLRCLPSENDIGLAEAFTLYLSWKGKATRLQSAALLMLQSADDAALAEQRQRLTDVNRELSDLILRSFDSGPADGTARLKELGQERIRLEKQISQSLGLDQVFQTPTAADLQQLIPADGVLIDFFVGLSVYAWVIRANSIDLIRLGSALELEQEQRKFLKQHGVRGGRTLAADEQRRSELAALLWQPLREAVGDAERVWLCPDGFLNELAFGILPLPTSGTTSPTSADSAQAVDRYLMESLRLHYLTDSTRLLQAGKSSAAREGSLLAVGGVNYFKRDKVNHRAAGGSSLRSRLGQTWAPLSGTRSEVESLQAMIEHVLEWTAPVTVLTGTAASEEQVRAQLAGHRYLHLATHGYFEPDHLPSLVAATTQQENRAELGAKIEAVGMLPGLLAGLVFAGANRDPEEGEDDGYLSAEEITYMNLSACDLAVLSACQTALGSRRAGEGLMSLRRAFTIAGAQSVVSSLWKIDDQASAQLMADFYRNYFEHRLGKAEALHQAKLKMLRRNRAEYNGDARPLTWGAFVLSGEWN